MSFLPFSPKVNIAIIVATIAVGLDVTFHILLTEPMESFDYFAVKWLLGFFVTTILLQWRTAGENAIHSLWRVLVAAGAFSFLMSIYYRWWEFLSGVPYGIRPPDIIFIDRSDVALFALSWFVGHSVFYFTGILIARKLEKDI